METTSLAERPHRRFNPLLGEWVLVSPHRATRPWSGQVEDVSLDERRPLEPGCYLCPGNLRANGDINPAYSGAFVFKNDFPALLEGDVKGVSDGLFRSETVAGECRVICYSPRHDLSLAQMDPVDVRSVVDTWVDQDRELRQTYAWVQIFENKGESMGCSNPHPHGQIWASAHVPTIVARENEAQIAHFQECGRPLLDDVVKQELAFKTRVVAMNMDWAAIVPFWATWPFETLLISRTGAMTLADLSDGNRHELADILKRLLTGYDALFGVSLPYSMGWHAAPTHCERPEAWTLHAHFYPPLLRSATVRKFMVGYEMLGEAQRDITPEQAAERLRAVTP